MFSCRRATSSVIPWSNVGTDVWRNVALGLSELKYAPEINICRDPRCIHFHWKLDRSLERTINISCQKIRTPLVVFYGFINIYYLIYIVDLSLLSWVFRWRWGNANCSVHGEILNNLVLSTISYLNHTQNNANRMHDTFSRRTASLLRISLFHTTVPAPMKRNWRMRVNSCESIRNCCQNKTEHNKTLFVFCKVRGIPNQIDITRGISY